MKLETLFKTEQQEDQTVVIVEEKEITQEEQAREERHGVTAYSKSDNKGNISKHTPTFLIQQTQRVNIKTYGKGYKAKVFGASLTHQASNAYINIPPEGGTFELIPGYWVLSVTGTWASYYQGNWVAGGIFADANYK